MILKYNNRIVTYNNRWIDGHDPLNPFDLPPYTIRLLYEDGVTPSFRKGTGVQVSSSPNIWDLTYNNSDWYELLFDHTNLLEVLSANAKDVTKMNDMFYKCKALRTVKLFDTRNVTNMNDMFDACTKLTSVPLFDTSNVTNMSTMFYQCSSLETVPLFDTSKVTNMERMFAGSTSLKEVPLFDTSNVTNMYYMFGSCDSLIKVPLLNTNKVTDVRGMCYSCDKVESGALALYNQMSTQINPPSRHGLCFTGCGEDTQTGLAELQQIPQSWGGLANG